VLRYLSLSTVIVLGVAIAVAAWVNRDLIRIKIASVYARVPPKAGSAGPRERATTAPLHGDAPWALSALPDCLTQTSRSSGTLRYVRSRLPPHAVPIVPPATLVYGNCSIKVAGREAYVRRGADSFRIPPRAEFYREGASLMLLRASADGAELRIYQPVQR
jgi:hypothetical protein